MADEPRYFTLYALLDPRSEYQVPAFEIRGLRGVRYVGQTFKKISHRFARHLIEDSNPYKRNWVRKLKSLGLKPGIAALCGQISTQEEADRLERELIEEARKQIGAKLLNLAAGGQGGYYTEQQMEQSRNKYNSGADGYVRPGNTPYLILRDVVVASVRKQMEVLNNRYICEIGYTAQRDSLLQISTIQVGRKEYREAYKIGFAGGILPPGKLVVEAGYVHGRLARDGYATAIDEDA